MEGKQLFLHEVADKTEQMFSPEVSAQFVFMLEGVLKDYDLTKACYELSTDNMGLSEKLLRLFVATKRLEGMSEKTLKHYVYECRRAVDFLGKDLTEMTHYDLSYYISEIGRIHKLSRRSMDNMRRHMKGVFNWLEQNDYIESNPMSKISAIAFEQKEVKVLSDYEIQLLRDELSGKRDKYSVRLRAIVEFLLATGLRVSEVANCRLEDLDLENSEISVVCAKKRDKRRRTVFLTIEAKFYINEYLKLRDRYGWMNSGYLFQANNSAGTKLDTREINRELNLLGQACNITDKRCTCHLFRKTLASRLYRKGMNPTDIAYILGHADTRTSQRYYINIEKDQIKNSYLRIL